MEPVKAKYKYESMFYLAKLWDKYIMMDFVLFYSGPLKFEWEWSMSL